MAVIFSPSCCPKTSSQFPLLSKDFGPFYFVFFYTSIKSINSSTEVPLPPTLPLLSASNRSRLVLPSACPQATPR
jgi:hypothetical protein